MIDDIFAGGPIICDNEPESVLHAKVSRLLDETGWRFYHERYLLTPKSYAADGKADDLCRGSNLRADFVVHPIHSTEGNYAQVIECKPSADLNSTSKAIGQLLMYREALRMQGAECDLILCLPHDDGLMRTRFLRKTCEASGIMLVYASTVVDTLKAALSLYRGVLVGRASFEGGGGSIHSAQALPGDGLLSCRSGGAC